MASNPNSRQLTDSRRANRTATGDASSMARDPTSRQVLADSGGATGSATSTVRDRDRNSRLELGGSSRVPSTSQRAQISPQNEERIAPARSQAWVLTCLVESSVMEGHEDTTRSTAACIDLLRNVKSLELTAEDVRSENAIDKLGPLVTNSREAIRREARGVVDYLRDTLKTENMSIADETRYLFERLRRHCDTRLTRGISVDSWDAIKKDLNRLLEISDYANTDLSFGTTMGVTMDFLGNHEESKTLAVRLIEKCSRDRERIKIINASSTIVRYATSIRDGLFLGSTATQAVSRDMRLLIEPLVSANRIRHLFIENGTLPCLTFITENGPGETKNLATTLYQKLMH